ncbi:MAG: amidohydrolase 3 [Sphingomonadales bacterium]|nr:amidohydrolase 3 [Sphingomonadales bacterium]
MTRQADIVIRNGLVVDGTGEEPGIADVAIIGNRIVAVGLGLPPGREDIDATGLIVTPGFVDVHTHYDGQATWSQCMSPSSGHGVTTVVIGNCGVGFAPCRPGDRAALINVMEGVEDIPEAVMAEGLPWEWETFPQFLDLLDRRSWDVDIVAYIPHSPLRVYVMGARGLNREAATAEDLRQMASLVDEAMAVGAAGFATSRTDNHKTGDGAFIPSYDAESVELEAMAAAVGRSGRGVVQVVPNLGAPEWSRELDLLVRLGQSSQRPVTFSLAQSHQDSAVWRTALDRVESANDTLGTQLKPQVFPRPMGIVTGLSASVHAFCLCESYLAIADLPLSDRVKMLSDPQFRARLLSEKPAGPTNPLFRLVRDFDRMYSMAAFPNYEPAADSSVAARAMALGVTPLELTYDLLLEDDGLSLLYLPFSNYADQSLDAVRTMLLDANTVLGLGDGGAHYGLICDASYPTTLLAHWTRDRPHGRIPLAWAIKSLSADTADLIGLHDRGRIAAGFKADINLIDYQALNLHRPLVSHDLPGGGRRLTQTAEGFRLTMVSGRIVHRDDRSTGSFPGRLVRMGTIRHPARTGEISTVR